MQIGELLSLDRVVVDADVASKKRTLELLSGLLSNSSPELSSNDVFDTLLARERLGSTGLGAGVAIPHGRLKGLDKPVAAFARLHTGIDYDAPDKQPVDLLFALLVPEECTDAHLNILAQLARLFRDEETVEQLRACTDSDSLYRTLTEWSARDAA
ncbi:PTS sugar transporter subunit IIA [Acidihalobacter ferrooxydans]|uniref:PTS sugar transporter subunit IIA n=1 Tax=Acidihalobacter ferrooxydans TaxID=1765967 RepID=A0A1P8UJC4_9GAMM|nr:PTS sugar transporter subunit IIA [Acidihalobacter ferrooxydans]APZ43937.1 PTS sugar transporter subunit IIA [Acidihalobacter ferrooxydans]